MDPVAHTLVGAALAQSGLKRRTALGTATLLIGANAPDIDILSLAWGEPFELSFRRGWTHGVLALVVLPFVVAGVMMLWDRFVRRARAPDKPAAIPGQLLFLAAVAVLTHPTLDSLNVYGMRWLTPFSDRWFYGDVLFIIDPWFWAILAAGIWLSVKRPKAERPARIALAALVGYIVLMAGSAVAARRVVWRSVPFSRANIRRIMVAPLPVNPFRKYVVIDEGDAYRVGTFSWFADPKIRYGDLATIQRRAEGPDVSRAAATTNAARFLSWARFPFFVRDAGAERRAVHIIDARYALEENVFFGALTVEVDLE